MSRLKRFEEYRFVGTRDTMRVYDCDDADHLEDLEIRAENEDLLNRDLLQSFAPDSLDEAANRGFKLVY